MKVPIPIPPFEYKHDKNKLKKTPYPWVLPILRLVNRKKL